MNELERLQAIAAEAEAHEADLARRLAADEAALAAANDRAAADPSVHALNAKFAAARVAARTRAELELASARAREARRAADMADVQARIDAGLPVTAGEALALARYSKAQPGDAKAERIALINTLRYRYAIDGRALTPEQALRHPAFKDFHAELRGMVDADSAANKSAEELAARIHARLRNGEA